MSETTNASLEFTACIPFESYLVAPEESAHADFRDIADFKRVNDMKDLLPENVDSDMSPPVLTTKQLRALEKKMKRPMNEQAMNVIVKNAIQDAICSISSWKGKGVRTSCRRKQIVNECELGNLFLQRDLDEQQREGGRTSSTENSTTTTTTTMDPNIRRSPRFFFAAASSSREKRATKRRRIHSPPRSNTEQSTKDSKAKQQRMNFNGLPVTSKSRPDFAFWNTKNQVLVLGEGKNNSTYDPKDAYRQCVSYLIANLYYCVVLKQKPVETVYGFTICGPLCKDVAKNGTFRVDLISLSLPNIIGGKLQMRLCSSNSIDDLATFLNILPEISPAEEEASSSSTAGDVISLRCSSLLKIPKEMLREKAQNDSWSVVKNATSALVMKLEDANALAYLAKYLSTSEQETIACFWEDHNITFPCYLKVKNKLATHCPENVAYTRCVNNKMGNLGERYIGNIPVVDGLLNL